MSTDVKTKIDKIVRRERGRLLADLVTRLGPNSIELAEDMVQDALSAGLQQWEYSGLPDNPAAWLNKVARNKAYDRLKKLNKETLVQAVDDNLIPNHSSSVIDCSNLNDPELELFFMCCQHKLNQKEQLSLILNLASGFTAKEIAGLLLSTEAATAKLLARSKAKLRIDRPTLLKQPSLFAIKSNLKTVHKAVYLLFTIGYSSTGGETITRKNIAFEALRLIKLLLANSHTTSAEGHAIAALICFQSARLPARTTDKGEIILLKDQDQSLWDMKLINEGFTHLCTSKNAPHLTRYHLEAAIASIHILPNNKSEIDWTTLNSLYEKLTMVAPSPTITLNRVIVEMMLGNLVTADALLDTLSNNKHMIHYAPYYLVKGELYERLGRHEKAKNQYNLALQYDINLPLQQLLENKISDITLD